MRGRALTRAVLAVAWLLLLPSASEAYVYWANQGTGTIGRANLDGSRADQAFIAAGSSPCGVAVNATHVFWAHAGGIGRTDLDGSNADLAFITGTGSRCGVVLGQTKMWWANQGSDTVAQGNLTGAGQPVHDYVSSAFAHGPCGVAFDGSHVYWANGHADTIGRVNFDGQQPTGSFITGADAPCGVAVDGSHLYWANQGSHAIARANRDGTGANQSFIALPPESAPCGVAVDAAHVWWANEFTGTIGRAALGGTGAEHALVTGASDPCGIAVAPPAAPVVTGSEPASPADDTTPRIEGMAQPGATVLVYDDASCSGSALGSGPADDFNAGGIEVTVAQDSTTTFYARVRDGDYDSACSATSVGYADVPSPPTLTGTAPASPADDTQPLVQGTAEPGTTVSLYSDSTCAGPVAATGSAADFASPGLQVTVADGSTTTLRATATGPGGESACSPASITYVELVPPPAPTDLASTPASPADDTHPRIRGTAEPGSTVRLYAGAACTGPVVATGSAAELAAGLPVTVANGSTTTFRARAQNAAGSSPCSTSSVTYVELGAIDELPPPGSPPPSQPPPPPAAEPSVTGLRLSPARFATARGRSRRRSGTTVTAGVAAASRVRFTVQARTAGRRVGSRCVAPRRRNRRARRCTFYRAVGGSFAAITAGRASLRVRWNGRLRGRRLRPGRYRLVATPFGASGAKGQPVNVQFRVVAR
jgi:hypothetical protein